MVAISAGYAHTAAVRSDGTVWTWGDNGNGQLGDGTMTDRLTPVQVVGLTDIVAVSAGWDFTLALRRDGTVWAWGSNMDGELGDGAGRYSPMPAVVPSIHPVGPSRARASASGTKLTVGPVVVTARFPDCIYVEDGDRTGGIRVAPAPLNVSPGQTVRVTGTAAVIGGEKTLSLLSAQASPDLVSVSALAIGNESLGGGDLLFDPVTGAGQEGVFGWRTTGGSGCAWAKSTGLNNVGLLVRIWGRVIDVEQTSGGAPPAWFEMSDGSRNKVRVTVPVGVDVPEEGGFVSVTGISSCERVDTCLVRLLRARQQSDITILQESP